MSNENFKLGLPSRERKLAVDFEASQTVQDDALSLREILVRFGAGQPLPSVQNNQDGFPFGDMEDSDFAFGDVTDIVEQGNIASDAQNRIDEIIKSAQSVQQDIKSDEQGTLGVSSDKTSDDNKNLSQN